MRPVDREILKLAIPSIITNITTPLLALMDVTIVGHMGDASYIAAIAVGGTIFNMLYWLFGFLRMGTSGMSAQACGASDRRRTELVLARGLLVAITISVVMIMLSGLLRPMALDLMELSGTVREMAGSYFSILIWGAPAVLTTYTFSGWFIGLKNTKAPMLVSFVINLSNIAVSLGLVFIFGMKIDGVAIGTLSAQWLGAIVCLIMARLRYSPSLPPFSEILRIEEIKRFFSINADIFLRTICLIAVTVWFTRTGAGQGTLILAVNTLLMQFFVFFSYFMDGFAFAGESLSGNRLGAGDSAGLHHTVNALIKWGTATASVFTVIYVLTGTEILGLLSDDGDVIAATEEFRNWVIVIPFAGFLAFTWDGIFIGLTATRAMLMSMIVATIVFFVSYTLLFPFMGNHGLWTAFILYLLSRGIILSLLYRKRTV